MRNKPHVEVTPKLTWHIHDYAGVPGSPEYHDITNYYATNYYAAFVVAQGVLSPLDFSLRDSFSSPDTGKLEKYFDGLVARFAVSLSNGTAYLAGRLDYDTHFGVVKSYEEDDEALYAQQLRHLSTRFNAKAAVGHELCIGVGEDDDEGPLLSLTFRPSTARLSKFAPESLQ